MSLIRDAIDAVRRLVPEALPGALPSEAPPDPLIDARRVIGTPLSRVDGPLKVAGKARFAAEVPLDGLVYAALRYSAVARGRIAVLDTAAAEAAPGVLLVMTHRNAPRLSPPPLMMADPRGAAASSLPVMQDATIRWNGEPVALVVAATQEQAEHAASLIRIDYEAEAAALSFDAAKPHAAPPGDILGEPTTIKVGDAEAAVAGAAFRVDRIYRTPRHNHCAIEPHAVTVAWEGDSLTIHDATQMVHLTRSTMAAVFGIAEEQVRVLSPFVGGGFGNKAVWNHHVLAAAAARMVNRPVRLALSREGVFRATGGRTLTEQRVALGAKADGTLAGLIHSGVTGITSHNQCPEQFSFPARHLYAADSFLITQSAVELDMVANTFMRAPGESIGTFALESAIDELAETMGLDPVELRRRLEPERDPTSGLAFSSRHLVEAYRRGAERFGWDRRNPTPRARRDGDWLIGQGVATATYPYYRMPGGEARIRLRADGHAVVQMAAHEMGMGTATVQAQQAAERLGLPVERVTFEYGDSALPRGTLAGGSSQSASIAAAVAAAQAVLVEQLLRLAGNDSPLAGLKPAEVEARDGGLCYRDDPRRCESYASILRRAGQDELVAEAAAPPPAETQAYSMHSYGAQFCELRVNAVTGETRVTRWVGSFNTGRILNPKTAASQFRGGIIMGLGLALTEETLFDERTGRIMNPSLADYHVPVHLDVPEIDVIWNDIPDPHSPLGLHGIGEIGITGVGAAVANAVHNATGIRVRELPITLDKLL
ncbi:xanthine dehydrogenase YagR molybdenum-binding subunit [Azospirillum agricola]|uniref:xanthine dehydrogenase family protein molybdopterin-binding subunit n=1 Tax=Azospirillum agricola TaxID=1720247 RepID=UPI001AE6C12A|nr:xanthine dehydrogenase family protein molybdopterin-binding subunit [Azospirillum agricola]MBP2231248.1 xanthine dehydrogenase YagR molybdenum-binding subunit [Azospirillum agricola]